MISGMKMPGSTSPMRLASRALIGGAVTVISFLLLILPIPLLRVDHCVELFSSKNLLRLTVVLIPLLSGLAVSLMAERQLRRGIDNEEWQERELGPLRKVLAHPVWTVISVIPLVALLGYGVTSNLSHGLSLFWSLMIPAQTISRLRVMVKPKRVAGGALQDWRSFKPIQSEHWGEPRQDSISS
jgi:hypothetical protein